ncbi:MAG: hypothetical protein WAL47_11875 [Pyrinomonadaceae bacterium]
MRINIQIERLVLDRLPFERHQGPFLKAAVEAELSRLVAAHGLAESVLSSGAVPATSAPGFQLTTESSASQVGQQIGRSVYGGLGK